MTLGMNGGTAVMFFFVISGFLISFVLDEKYDYDLRSTYAFYKSRFVRIYSLYWPAYLFAAVVTVGLVEWSERSVIDNAVTWMLLGADWRLSLGPVPVGSPDRWGHLYLFMAGTQPAWTLATELAFYVIAPFVLRSLTAVLVLFSMSLLVRLSLVHEFGFYEVWTYYFFPSVILFFLLGHLSRILFRKFPLNSYVSAAFLIPAFTFSMLGVGKQFDSLYFYLSVISFSAALPGLFALTKDNRFLNALGHLSYPVYLTHAALLLFYAQVPWLAWLAPQNLYLVVEGISANPITQNLLVGGIVSLVVTGLATIVYFSVEKPFGRVLWRGLGWIETRTGKAAMRARRRREPDFVEPF